ncbi:hypothetical protein [Neorhizobium sp. P12A]|uniref:hypothetical protein n=1 Tax=Neorhizobium sp. P12A TaxID=2268027 RepID=UPI001FEF0DB2|nr:hypothetical protein [Neorhizobium sp. P12A]
MKVVYTDRHRAHIPGDVVENGLARPRRDVPERLDALLRAIHSLGHDVVGVDDHGTSPLAAVHSKAYLVFLATAYRDWQRHTASPGAWCRQRSIGDRKPTAPTGRRSQSPASIFAIRSPLSAREPGAPPIRRHRRR